MFILPLGSTDTIGASALYLQMEGTGLLLDAGQDPNIEGREGLPKLDQIGGRDRPLDHVIITHAHHDHVGALPVVAQTFPHVSIRMTRPTRLLLDVVLPASARLQRKRLTEAVQAAQPTFSEEQAEAVSFLYQAHELEETFRLEGTMGGTVEATFYHAGHVLGSAGVLLESETDSGRKRVFYTSDTCLRPQTIIPGADFPSAPIDVLILESTLAADPEAEYSLRKDVERSLAESIERVLARGGTVLIPVFALGRAQEVVALIDVFKQRGYIPQDTPVYTSGSMRVISDIYDRTRYTSPRINKEFEVFGVEQRRLPRNLAREREALAEPSIHIAASGMMFERTLSNAIARRLISHERHAVFFVGFLKEDTPGYNLVQAVAQGPGTEITLDRFHEPQKVQCEVKTFRLSGHSHRRDLIQIVELLKPPTVVLVHGESKAKRWMADNIQYFYPDTRVLMPGEGEPLDL